MLGTGSLIMYFSCCRRVTGRQVYDVLEPDKAKKEEPVTVLNRAKAKRRPRGRVFRSTPRPVDR